MPVWRENTNEINGILEELERYIKVKITIINALLGIRSEDSVAKYRETFKDVCNQFSEIDNFVELTSKTINNDISHIGGLSRLVEANLTQRHNIDKITKIVTAKNDFDLNSDHRSRNMASSVNLARNTVDRSRPLDGCIRKEKVKRLA